MRANVFQFSHARDIVADANFASMCDGVKFVLSFVSSLVVYSARVRIASIIEP